MEIRETEVPIQKLVEIGYKKVIVYITKDGKSFSIEKDAIAHETRLIAKEILDNIPRAETECLDVSGSWYYISSEEEMQILIRRTLQSRDIKFYGDKIYPSWYTYNYDHGGDYADSMEMYSWNYVKRCMDDIYKQMEKVIGGGRSE